MSKEPRLQVIRLTSHNPHHKITVEAVPPWSNGGTHEVIAEFEVGDGITFKRAKRIFTETEGVLLDKAGQLADLLCEADVPPLKID